MLCAVYPVDSPTIIDRMHELVHKDFFDLVMRRFAIDAHLFTERIKLSVEIIREALAHRESARGFDFQRSSSLKSKGILIQRKRILFHKG